MCVTEDTNSPQQSPERNERVRLIRHSELTFSSPLHFSASRLIKVQMAAAHLIVAEQIPPQILATITQMSALSCLSRHLCLPITKCCIRKMCQTVTTGHKLILLIFFCFVFSSSGSSVALAPLLMCAEAPNGFLWRREAPDERVDTVQHGCSPQSYGPAGRPQSGQHPRWLPENTYVTAFARLWQPFWMWFSKHAVAASAAGNTCLNLGI